MPDIVGSTSRKPRLHFHSDCEFFAGSERPLPLIWDDPRVRDEYEVTLSYRQSARYEEGLHLYLAEGMVVYPIVSAPPLGSSASSAIHQASSLRHRVLRRTQGVWELLLRYPRFTVDVIRMIGVFRQIRPSVAHLNNGGYPGARSVRAAAVAARLTGCPRIVMVVNNIAHPYSTVGRLVDLPLDLLVRRCTDTFVTASTDAREALISVLRLSEERVVQIPNAVPTPQPTIDPETLRTSIGIGDETIVVGVVALLEARKGHRVLLAALEKLNSGEAPVGHRVTTWIVGDGELRDELMREVEARGLRDSIDFLGYRDDYVNLMAAMDIVLLPSLRNEDSPLSTLEAMALAKPVVASAVAGLSEQVLDGVTGYLVNPGDADALANRLAQLVNGDSERARLGAAGRQRYEGEFSPVLFVERYLGLYSSG